jgi:dTDP-4-amino-4,6-dideoxygalactose transaminase
MEHQIPYHPMRYIHPEIREEMTEAFRRVYDAGWYVLGDQVRNFEEAYAHFGGSRYALGVGSGLDALFIALKCLDIGPGDEVILPANSFIATALAVLHCGAIPVLADPDPATFNLGPERISEAITSRTRAVIPVHLFGNPCPMAEIIAIGNKNGLEIVEDNAQAQGARHRGRRTGSYGRMGAASFYPIKNLGALGDGGIITTDDSDLWEKAARLRNYGGVVKDHWELPGYNSRLDELQAAFLLVKLKHLDSWNASRRSIALRYLELLASVGDLLLPVYDPDDEPVFHVFPVRTAYRDELRRHLDARGIGTLVHYPVPMHLQPALAQLGIPEGTFPAAEAISRTELSLPIYPGLKEHELQQVADAIQGFFKNR